MIDAPAMHVQLHAAMAAMQEQAVEYCRVRGIGVCDFANPDGQATDENPIVLRGADGNELARFWYELAECSAAVKVQWA